jgi:hypothetical protein
LIIFFLAMHTTRQEFVVQGWPLGATFFLPFWNMGRYNGCSATHEMKRPVMVDGEAGRLFLCFGLLFYYEGIAVRDDTCEKKMRNSFEQEKESENAKRSRYMSCSLSSWFVLPS